MVDLKLLGGLDLVGPDGGSLLFAFSQPKRIALLAFLVTARDSTRTRDAITAVFWPEMDDRNARAALRRALHYVRTALPPGALISGTAGEVRVDREFVRCDVVEFAKAVQQGRFVDAVAMYRGDLLDGFYLADSVEFQQWLDLERQKLRDTAAAAARSAALQEEGVSDHAVAIRRALRWLELSPFSDEAMQRCLSLYSAQGEGAAGVRLYESFAGRLRDELSLDPAPETSAAADRIRLRASAPVGIVSTDPPDPYGDSAPRLAKRASRSRARVAAGLLTIIASSTSLILFLIGRSAAPRSDPVQAELPRVVVYTLGADVTSTEAIASSRVASDWLVDRIAAAGIAAVFQRDAPRSSVTDLRTDARHRGADILFTGTAVHSGDSLRFHVRAFETANGKALGSVDVKTGVDRISRAADELASRSLGLLATRLHADLSAFMTDPVPPRYEAYLAYTDGISIFQRYTENRAARTQLRRAFLLDTAFLAPLVLEARASLFGADVDPVLGDSLVRFLTARWDRLSPLQRAEVNAFRGRLVGDRTAEYRAYAEAARVLPDKLYEFGVAAVNMGRPREGLAALLRVPDPGQARNYWKMVSASLHFLGEHERERQVALDDIARTPGQGRSLNPLVYALCATGRLEELRAVLSRAELLPPEGGVPYAISLRYVAAVDLLNHGAHSAESKAIAREGVDRLRQQATVGNPDLEAYWDLLHLAGEYDQLLALARQRLEGGSQDQFWLAWGGYAAARVGRTVEAERFLSRLLSATDGTTDPEILFNLAMLQAALGEREAALGSIRHAIRLGKPWSTLHMEQHRLESLRGDPEFREIISARG